MIDEAGMLDQDSAIALLTVAPEASATIALVGDRAQLPAVGRGGVLDYAVAIAAGIGQTVHDLDTVHRFADPAYAELSVQLREGHEPAELFDRLVDLGLVQLHASDDGARTHVSQAAEPGAAITVATNEEARDLNDRIHTHRVAGGEVDDTISAFGSDDLPIGVGDVIATRRNDTTLGVANRQTWIVQQITAAGNLSVLEAGTAHKHHRAVNLPASYVADHVQLAYAATAYGVQGVTATNAHTMLSESLDSAGLYVGMTRARNTNRLHIVADNLDDARDQFTEAMERDRADRGLDAAATEARTEVRGLAATGPVKIVNDERALLSKLIDQAERQAARWERAADMLTNQANQHETEKAAAHNALLAAERHLAATRADTLAPLLAQAVSDAQTYLAADAQEREALTEVREAGRLTQRRAERRHATTVADKSDLRDTLVDRWGSTPEPDRWGQRTRDSLEPWAERVASLAAESSPEVEAARHTTDHVRSELREIQTSHRREDHEHNVAVYGRRDAASLRRISGPNSDRARAQRWRQRCNDLGEYLARIESLPIGRAIDLIEQQCDARSQMARLKPTAPSRAQTTPPAQPISRDGRPPLQL